MTVAEEPATITLIAQQFMVTMATASESVDGLERRGLVVKNRSSSDRRSYSLKITVTGKAVYQEAFGALEELADALLPSYGEEDFRLVEGVFKAIENEYFRIIYDRIPQLSLPR